ncbi:MAG TPA: DUF4386 domain-containing protein [Acidobacteriaceae bacterium]
MQPADGIAARDRAQQACAQLAGALMLGVIVLALGSGAVLSHISGNGTYAETAARIAASERLYRVALSVMLIVSLCSTLLAFALYVTLRPVHRLLAQLGLIFTLADSFLALLVRMCSFVRLHLYLTATPLPPISHGDPLLELMRTIAATTENIGGISFGIGSCLFFYLFYKSSYIPRSISALGVIASVLWTSLYFARLIVPELHTWSQYLCFPPMALAEIATGVYLVSFRLSKKDSSLRAPAAAGS